MRDYILTGMIVLGPTLTTVAVILIRRMHKTFNSKMDRMLELTAKAAKAEGVLEERTRAETERRDRFITG